MPADAFDVGAARAWLGKFDVEAVNKKDWLLREALDALGLATQQVRELERLLRGVCRYTLKDGSAACWCNGIGEHSLECLQARTVLDHLKE